MRRSDLPADGDSVGLPLAEPDVEDRDIRVDRGDPRQRLLSRRGLADDGDVLVGVLEQIPEARPDDLVIVEEEDVDHLDSSLVRNAAATRCGGVTTLRSPRPGLASRAGG